jgi:hypothetical protein
MMKRRLQNLAATLSNLALRMDCRVKPCNEEVRESEVRRIFLCDYLFFRPHPPPYLLLMDRLRGFAETAGFP